MGSQSVLGAETALLRGHLLGGWIRGTVERGERRVDSRPRRRRLQGVRKRDLDMLVGMILALQRRVLIGSLDLVEAGRLNPKQHQHRQARDGAMPTMAAHTVRQGRVGKVHGPPHLLALEIIPRSLDTAAMCRASQRIQ